MHISRDGRKTTGCKYPLGASWNDAEWEEYEGEEENVYVYI